MSTGSAVNYTTIASALKASFSAHATRPALHVEGRTYTYGEIGAAARTIAQAIMENSARGSQAVGILASRSVHTFTGIFGTLMAGRAYVPLNPENPIERLVTIAESAALDTIVLSQECTETFEKLGNRLNGLSVICREPGASIQRLVGQFPNHAFAFPGNASEDADIAVDVSPEDPAYILFTSGTTGVPKGVLIRHRNACAYANFMINKYRFGIGDRHSNVHDISFDFSVHDIFLSVLSGGCLFVLPKSALISPAEYINANSLTVWSSVPSVAMLMSRLGKLEPATLPSLRFAFFCGEALQLTTAQAWARAACNCILDNIYGPTEATVSITAYRYDDRTTPSVCVNGVVPIGSPYDGHRVRVVDEQGAKVADGDIGELCLSGPQVASGYYNNEPETQKRFVEFPDEPGTVWYRTGDVAKRLGVGGPLVFMGRADEQVKVKGYRIEMLEIEKALRDATRNQMAVCVPVISDERLGVIDEIHAYVEGERDDYRDEDILKYMETKLPWYMIPSTIHVVRQLPLNANGKIDKGALKQVCNKEGRVSVADDRSAGARRESLSVEGSQLAKGDAEVLQSLGLVKEAAQEIRCCRCFKGLNEDKKLRGVGLIRILNHQGKEAYICHVCLGGF